MGEIGACGLESRDRAFVLAMAKYEPGIVKQLSLVRPGWTTMLSPRGSTPTETNSHTLRLR